MDIIQVITKELNVEKWQVEAAVKLIDEGCTIPFISRYRKEATGSLNDEQLRTLHERLTYLRNLEEKKNQVLGSIEEQGKLTDELKKAISEKESQIRNLKLDQKEEELKVKNTQKSLDSQTVKATISGVVKKVGNAENPSNDGSAFIQVSGNEGLYVRGYLSETYLDQVKVGDELNVTSWSSGAFAAATVTEISPYPTTSYMSYSETPASFYPFTAVIPEGGEGFENGDWIEIAITVGNDVENGNGLYVSKEFIREENGQKFVYIRDENDKLKKQNVVTGKLLWGSYYEVKSGLSEEDYIAFTYGKTVVEGADTKESSSSDYYNS